MNAKKLSMVFPRRPCFLKWAVLGMFLFIFPTPRVASANVANKPLKASFESQNPTEILVLKKVSDTEHESDMQNHLKPDSDSADCGCNPLLPDADRNDNRINFHPKRQINHAF